MIDLELEAYFDRLWPLLRSITGDGVRRTHDILSECVPLQRLEVPSGTAVFDWTVPKEWVVRGAYVIRPDGKKILDVTTNNLHLVNYSAPFRGRVSRAELEQHLHSLAELPSAIPYVTSYYTPRWGFCIAHEERAYRRRKFLYRRIHAIHLSPTTSFQGLWSLRFSTVSWPHCQSGV
jgi:aminopeptidase-like protein